MAHNALAVEEARRWDLYYLAQMQSRLAMHLCHVVQPPILKAFSSTNFSCILSQAAALKWCCGLGKHV